eukprot:scaffold21401_cov116-Isochrysis_galbana.AAC.3
MYLCGSHVPPQSQSQKTEASDPPQPARSAHTARKSAHLDVESTGTMEMELRRQPGPGSKAAAAHTEAVL